MSPWRHPRRTASVLRALLFFWLFGIAASWANACLVQDRPAPHRHEISMPAEATHEHDDASGVGDEACLSFCDSEQGVVPTYKLPVQAGLDAALPTPLGAAWAAWVVDAPPERGRLLSTPPPPASPVAIRFLRLSL